LEEHRAKQQNASSDEDVDDDDSEDEVDSDDDEDNEDDSDRHRRPRTARQGSPPPTVQAYYPRQWKKVLNLTKDRIFHSSLLGDFFPDQELCKSKVNDVYLPESVVYAEKTLKLRLEPCLWWTFIVLVPGWFKL
jgi:hypothetical protein